MSVSTLPGAHASSADEAWVDPHPHLRRVLTVALTARLLLGSAPTHDDIALLGGLAGVIAGRSMRRVGAAAFRALGATNSNQAATWRFAARWWSQRAACAALDYQADQVTRAWAARHVLVSQPPPRGGCILVSIHDFNQRFAFARLATLIDELGIVSLFEPLPENDPRLRTKRLSTDARSQLVARSRFCHEVFGPRVFLPRSSPRRGLELLRRGGSMIVLVDYLGREPVSVLGKRWLVPLGPIWWAEQSARPIVPFAISPVSSGKHRWQLWFGEPISPTPRAMGAALEACIRRSPTSWLHWPAWHAAPAAER